ncbi:HD-GYP domain-containing protein [Angustibacter aerolatus]
MTGLRRAPLLTPAAVVASLATLLAVAGVAAAAATVSAHGLHSAPVVVAFAASIAVGECLRVWLPGDRDAAPIGTAAAFAFALVGEVGGPGLAPLSSSVVVGAAGLATVAGLLPHLLTARTVVLDGPAHRFVALVVLVLLWREVPLGDDPAVRVAVGFGPDRWPVALMMLVAVGVALVVDALLAACVRFGRESSRLGAIVRDELRALGGLGSAIGATGVLIALAARPMGLLALPLFIAPLLLTQFAFRRYARVRATYGQTIRSLSRVTELGGYTETGHSRRVAELSLAVGRDLGLGERALQDLEYAALLHDIGQLSLAEPIPGGATVMAAPGEQRRIADLGAAVVREAGVLDTVATIVERQTEPYRRRLQSDDVDVPLASRIIKAANAYDDLVGDDHSQARRLEALERIHLGLAYEYDPRVVSALSRVLQRAD